MDTKTKHFVKTLQKATRAAVGVATSGAVMTSFLSLWCENARADEPCGIDDTKYVETIATGMQQYATQVTRTGSFRVKVEYPGDTTSTLVLSFLDRGKTVFIHRIVGISAMTPTEMRPSKTVSSGPELLVRLSQGNIGECQYTMLTKNGKFVVVPRGIKWYKQ